MEARARIHVEPPVSNPLPSYWHNPKSQLANITESESNNATQTYDYAIIGSGISGTTTAFNLLKLRPDARIVMLEAREVCGGATGRNGGHTKAASYRTYLQHKEELGKDEALRIARLEYDNILATHRMVEEIGIECENQLCNTVDLIYDDDTFEQGKQAIDTLRQDASEEDRKERGMAWYKVYSAEEAAEKFFASKHNGNPEVQKDEKLVGAFEYLAGRINAYRFTTGLLAECVKKGLKLYTNMAVHDVLPPEEDNGISYVVYTEDITILARSVVYATNGYTPYLLSQLQGVIVPLRGQITAQRPGKAAKLPSPLPTTYSFIYKSGYEYMVPRPLAEGGQHIVIGGGLGREPEAGAPEYGTVDDSSLNTNMSRYLRGSLVGYFGEENWGELEGDREQRVVQEWTGIMGATADGRPLVGAVPGVKGVWISAGFNGHGMVLCLKSAEALVEMMLGADAKDLEWFPNSFSISEERIQRSSFRGRTDMIPETGGLAACV
jgi:glycine/D-amino acid oxidase-like deaminating enzyme